MGHSPIIKPNTVASNLGVLHSGTITSLLTTGVPHICSHQ